MSYRTLIGVHQQIHRCDVRVLCVQDQYEKALMGLQQRVQELETRLKGVQMVLQEKVQLLKEQVSSPSAGLTTRCRQHCISHFLFLWSSDGEDHQVEQPVEGALRGKCSVDDGTADHRAAAEECREEELCTGGKGRRPQQAAEGRCSRRARHVNTTTVAYFSTRTGMELNHQPSTTKAQKVLSHAQHFLKQIFKKLRGPNCQIK